LKQWPQSGIPARRLALGRDRRLSEEMIDQGEASLVRLRCSLSTKQPTLVFVCDSASPLVRKQHD
jgi:hypothetical protein